VWADGQVAIDNAPGAGSGGAFDFSGQKDWTTGGNSPGNGFVFNGSLVNATNASGNWTIGNSTLNNRQSNGYDGSAIRMNAASYGTIINNHFNGAGGNVIGMYARSAAGGQLLVKPRKVSRTTRCSPLLGASIAFRNRRVFPAAPTKDNLEFLKRQSANEGGTPPPYVMTQPSKTQFL
jgi:hypothetical protein